MSDRRVAFFLVAAVVCALLTFPSPPDLRWVPEVTAGVYLALAALSGLERLSASRERRRR